MGQPETERTEFDRRMMAEALRGAHDAWEDGEVPIGAVIEREGRIIGRGRNQRERLRDPTAHAEMIAITAAAEAVGDWRLEGCTLYVTLEPCAMCAGAIVLARLSRLVFGASDPKAGACGSLYTLTQDARLNWRVPTDGGVMAWECGEVLSAFFAEQRRAGKK